MDQKERNPLLRSFGMACRSYSGIISKDYAQVVFYADIAQNLGKKSHPIMKRKGKIFKERRGGGWRLPLLALDASFLLGAV